MRRIVLASLFGLALLPASAPANTHHCSNTIHERKEAFAIVAHGIDCHTAHGLAHHVIVWGNRRLVGWHCSGSIAGREEHWSCEGTHQIAGVLVTFSIKNAPKVIQRP